MRKILLLSALLVLLTNVCTATKYYWKPTSGSNWNTAANWQTGSYSGGTTASSTPGTADTVYFGDNSTACTLNVNATITNLVYESTNSIFINTSTSSILTVTGNITLSNSNSTGGGTALIKVGGTGTQYIYGTSISGQSKLPNLTFAGSGTENLSGYITMGGSTTLTYSSGTLNAGTSDFIFYYNNTITGGIELKNVEFQGTNSTVTLTDSLIVDSIATISLGYQVLLNTGKLNVKGSVVVSNTSTYTGGTATINFIGSGNSSLMATSGVSLGEGYLPYVKISKTGGTLSLYGNISVEQGWTNNYSEANINPGTSAVFFFYGNNTVNIGGTYSTPLWSVTLGGSQNCTYNLNADSTLVIEHSLIITGTNYVNISGDWLNVRGSLTISNTSIYSGGTAYINFTGSANDSITATSAVALGEGYLPSVQINKTGGTLSLFGKISVQQGWTNNYTTASINPGTSTLFPFYANNTFNIGGTHPMPLWNVIFGGSYNSTYSINADSAFIINDTFTLTGNHYLTISGHSLKIKGNVNMTSTYGTGFSVSTVFDIAGSANQVLCGSATLPVQTWVMNKSAGTFTLNEPLTLSTSLTLTSGVMVTSSTNILTLNNGATVSGASNSSFVNGPIEKIGNAAFVFPTGAGSSYHPIGISAPSSTSDGFTAQYFNTQQTLGSATDDTLTYVSSCDYWNLTHTTGSSSSKVTLYWGTSSCNIDRLSTLRVAYWNGSEWTSIGNSATTGSTSSGSVTATSTSSSSSFGNFAIGKHSPTPTPSAGSNVTICNGSSTTLGASASGGFTPYSYAWAPTTGLSATNIYNPVATPTITTTYTVTVNDADNAPTVTSTVVITVINPPTANAGSNTSICSTTSSYTLSGASASNYASLSWTTSGTGRFSSTTTLNPTYTPSSADITAGGVTLTLTANANSPCSNATSSMTLIITAPPAANAGGNATICSSVSSYTLSSATASHYASLSWATSGTGTFSSSTTLNPVYTPSSADIITGSVLLTLTAINSPCSNSTSSMTLTIQHSAAAYAGSNINVCPGSPSYDLTSATASHYASLNWATSGTGVFSNTATLNPVYFPSNADITNGHITLTLTADGNSPCSNAMSSMILAIVPKVHVGNNATICAGNNYSFTTDTVIGYDSIRWKTTGTGVFNHTTAFHPTYTPSMADITSGRVSLTLTAYGHTSANVPCNVTDGIALTIISLPTAYAGNAHDTICRGSVYTFTRDSATHYDSLRWTTSGTGTYINATGFHPIYIPGTADTAAGNVYLYLNVYGYGGCNTVKDTVRLTLLHVPQVTVTAGADARICSGNTYTFTADTGFHYDSIEWFTYGTGTFNSIYSFHPTYTPSDYDIATGIVYLYIIGFSENTNRACGNFIADMPLVIMSPSTVYAGGADTICRGNVFTVSKDSATYYDSLIWTTGGDGHFSNTDTLFTTYIPGSADTAAGHVTLHLTAVGNNPCGNTSDSMVLVILPTLAPVVTIDSNTTICAHTSYTFSADTATNYDSIKWTSSGTGTFSSTTTLHPTYTPSIRDMKSGRVFLYLTAYGNTHCVSVSASMTLSISPWVNIGGNAVVSFNQSFHFTADTAMRYDSLKWQTGGSGTFNNINILHPIYTPGGTDSIVGLIPIYLTATGNSPCGNASDTAQLQLQDDRRYYYQPPMLTIEDLGSLSSSTKGFGGLRNSYYFLRGVKLSNVSGNTAYNFTDFDSIRFMHKALDVVPGTDSMPYYVVVGLAKYDTAVASSYVNGLSVLPSSIMLKTFNYPVNPDVRTQYYYLSRKNIDTLYANIGLSNRDSILPNSSVKYYEVVYVSNCFSNSLAFLNDSLRMNWIAVADTGIHGSDSIVAPYPLNSATPAFAMYQYPPVDVTSSPNYYDYGSQTQRLRWRIYNSTNLSVAKNIKMDLLQAGGYTSLQKIDSIVWHTHAGDSIIFDFSTIKNDSTGATVSDYPNNSKICNISNSGSAWAPSAHKGSTYTVKGIGHGGAINGDTFKIRTQQNYIGGALIGGNGFNWVLIDFDSTSSVLELNGAVTSMGTLNYDTFRSDYFTVIVNTLTQYPYDSCNCSLKTIRDWNVNVRSNTECDGYIIALSGLYGNSSTPAIPTPGPLIFPTYMYDTHDLYDNLPGGGGEGTGGAGMTFSGPNTYLGPSVPYAIPISASTTATYPTPPSLGYSTVYNLQAAIGGATGYDGNGKEQGIDIDIILPSDLFLANDPVLSLDPATDNGYCDSTAIHLHSHFLSIAGASTSTAVNDFTHYPVYAGAYDTPDTVKTPAAAYYNLSTYPSLACTTGKPLAQKLYRYRLTWKQLFNASGNGSHHDGIYTLLNNATLSINLQSKCGRGVFTDASGVENLYVNIYQLPNCDSTTLKVDSVGGYPNRILMTCGEKTITLLCPGCRNQGIESKNMNIVRKTYGYVDANDDGLWDGTTPTRANANTAGVNTNNVMQGDTFDCVLKTKIHLYENRPIYTTYPPSCDTASGTYLPVGNLVFTNGYWHLFFNETDAQYLSNPSVKLVGLYFKYQDNHYNKNNYNSYAPTRSTNCDTFSHMYKLGSQFGGTPFGNPWQILYTYASPAPYGNHYKPNKPQNSLDFFVDFSISKWQDSATGHMDTIALPLKFLDEAVITFYARFKEMANVANSSQVTSPLVMQQNVASRIYLTLDSEKIVTKSIKRSGTSSTYDAIKEPKSVDPGNILSIYPADTFAFQSYVPTTCGAPTVPSHSSCGCTPASYVATRIIGSSSTSDTASIAYADNCDSLQWYCTDLSALYNQVGYVFLQDLSGAYYNGCGGVAHDTGCLYSYNFGRRFEDGAITLGSYATASQLPNPFPYEYRHWNHTDSISIIHPSTFTYAGITNFTILARGIIDTIKTTFPNITHIERLNTPPGKTTTVLVFRLDSCGQYTRRGFDFFPMADDGFSINGTVNFANSCSDPTNYIDSPSVHPAHPARFITTLYDEFSKNFKLDGATYNQYEANGAFPGTPINTTLHDTMRRVLLDSFFRYNWDTTHMGSANVKTNLFLEKPLLQFDTINTNTLQAYAYDRCVSWPTVALHNANHSYMIGGLNYSKQASSIWLGYDTSGYGKNLCSVRFTFYTTANSQLTPVFIDSTVVAGAEKNYHLPQAIANNNSYVYIGVSAYVKSLCDNTLKDNTVKLKVGWTCYPCMSCDTCIHNLDTCYSKAQDSARLRFYMVNDTIGQSIYYNKNHAFYQSDTITIDSCNTGNTVRIRAITYNTGRGDIENNEVVVYVPGNLFIDTTTIYAHYKDTTATSDSTRVKYQSSGTPTTTKFTVQSTTISGVAYTRYTLYLNNLHHIKNCACEGTPAAEVLPYQPLNTTSATPDNVDSVTFKVSANCCVLAGQSNLIVTSRGSQCDTLSQTTVIPFKVNNIVPLQDSIIAPRVGVSGIKTLHANCSTGTTIRAVIGGAESYTWTPSTGGVSTTGTVSRSSTSIISITPMVTANTTFVLTATKTTGCTRVDSIVVLVTDSICTCGATQITATTTLSSTYTNQRLWFSKANGSVFHVGTVTFTDCELIMDPGVTIVVDPYSILTLQSTTTTYNTIPTMRLHGCDSLWNGIVVDTIGAQLIVLGQYAGGVNNVGIEDAQIGITCSMEGDTLNTFQNVVCSYVNFDNDIEGIKAQGRYGSLPRGNYFPLSVYGCNFRYIVNSSGLPIIHNTTGRSWGDIGIEIKDVFNDDAYLPSPASVDTAGITRTLTLGDETGWSGDTNSFSTLRWGIYAQRSNIGLYDCGFSNIHPYNGSGGVAVYCTARYRGTTTYTGVNDNVYNVMILGNNDIGYLNVDGCDTAFAIEHYAPVYASSTYAGGIFFTLDSWNVVNGKVGAYLNNVSLYNYDCNTLIGNEICDDPVPVVSLNNFAVTDYGVLLRGVYSNYPFRIERNNMNCTNTNTANNFVPTAIEILPSLLQTNNGLFVIHNSIYGFQAGVDINNLQGDTTNNDTMYTTIYGNKIGLNYVNSGLSYSTTNYIRGIGVSNCMSPRLGIGRDPYITGAAEHIYYPFTLLPPGLSQYVTYMGTAQKANVNGIYINQCTNPYIELDSIGNCGVGIYTAGPNPMANYVCNTISNWYGSSTSGAMYFTGNGTSIGPFTNSNTYRHFLLTNTTAGLSDTGCNNTFPNPPVINNSTYCGTGTTASGIKYITNILLIGGNTNNSYKNYLSTAPYKNCEGTKSIEVDRICPTCPVKKVDSAALRSNMLQSFMGSTLADSTDNIEDSMWTQYYSDRAAYNQLAHQPGLMKMGLGDDTVYLNYYHNHVHKNVGKFYTIDSLFNRGNFEAAQSVNNSIVPTFENEMIEQKVNAIYINSAGKTIDDASRSSLYTIANMNSIRYGKGVLKARAILGIVMDEPRDADNNIKTPRIKQPAIFDLFNYKLYPNPAADNVILDVNCNAQVTIVNMLGSTVMEIQVTAGKTIIDTHTLTNGVYLVNIKTQNCGHSVNQKLVITR